MSATIGIQPHIKGKITPQKLLPFPWEHHKAEVPAVSAEEARRRYEKLTKS